MTRQNGYQWWNSSIMTKKHMATNHTPFELNLRRHSWKGDLTIYIKLPKLEDFLEEL